MKNDHNLWNYVYYIVYLTTKDQTDYTGVESYVHELYQDQNVDWMPMNQALELESKEEELEEQMEQKVLNALQTGGNRFKLPKLNKLANKLEKNSVAEKLLTGLIYANSSKELRAKVFQESDGED